MTARKPRAAEKPAARGTTKPKPKAEAKAAADPRGVPSGSQGVAPIGITGLAGRTADVAVTVSGAAVDVYLDASERTKVAQPYRVTGREQVTLWRSLSGAETVTVTVLIGGEEAGRQDLALAPAVGGLVEVQAAPIPAGNVIDGGTP